MNPCINCPLDNQGCHESGFADAKCEPWHKWKTELLIFKAEERLRVSNLKIRRQSVQQTGQPGASILKGINHVH